MSTGPPAQHASARSIGASLAFLAVLLASTQAFGQVEIPPVPDGGHYILDRANVVSQDAGEHIGEIQRVAAEQHRTQIVVVTIDNMRSYGGGSMAIEEFARQWFDEWGIGIRRGGELYNRGILLLVSVGDRKARIELGAEWGHRWDAYCKRVMDEMIVPQFKSGDYSLGIIRGVDALSKMAERGPDADPPKASLADRWLGEAERWTEELSYFSPETQLVIALLGLLLVVASFFVDDEETSRWLFWGGLGLIAVAFVTYIVMAVVAVVFRGESQGYSGGGGFGGGFSGGGGATGSW